VRDIFNFFCRPRKWHEQTLRPAIMESLPTPEKTNLYSLAFVHLSDKLHTQLIQLLPLIYIYIYISAKSSERDRRKISCINPSFLSSSLQNIVYVIFLLQDTASFAPLIRNTVLTKCTPTFVCLMLRTLKGTKMSNALFVCNFLASEGCTVQKKKHPC
jgi:hypothetical protein